MKDIIYCFAILVSIWFSGTIGWDTGYKCCERKWKENNKRVSHDNIVVNCDADIFKKEYEKEDINEKD